MSVTNVFRTWNVKILEDTVVVVDGEGHIRSMFEFDPAKRSEVEETLRQADNRALINTLDMFHLKPQLMKWVPKR